MLLAAGRLEPSDYIVVVGYFVLMLAIGMYFYPQMRAMKDYFTGGNRIPWWLSGVSFYMSSFSVAAFVQYSALAYLYGWVAVSLYWVTVPAALVSVMLFSRRWRRARIDSPVEYLETRYNPLVRQLFAWQGIPVRIVDDALKLVAIALFIAPILNWSVTQSILIAGLVMLAYTFMGGLWAVTVTDFVQFVVMAVAVVVLLPLAMSAVGGWGSFVSNSPEGFFQFTHPAYGWGYLVSILLMFSLAWSTIQWALIQRYYCVPRERDALKVGWLVVVLNIITPPLMFLPAMAARQFLPAGSGDEAIYPMLCAHLLPAGMLGLVVAAMFAATMSMLSSDYNVCASVLTNDVYRRWIRPAATQQRLVWIGRFMTLVVGAVSISAALAIGNVGGEGLFRKMITLFSIATAPVAIPMIAGLFSHRATSTDALVGFLAGLSAGLLLFFICTDESTFFGTTWKKENVILFGATVTTVTAMVISGRWTRSRPEDTARIREFMRRLEQPIGTLEDDRLARPSQTGISPLRVVGLCVLLLGVLMLVALPWLEDRAALRLDLGIAAALLLIGTGTIFADKLTRSRQEKTS